MAVSLTHTTVATGTDAGNGEVAKAEWNEAHTLSMATARLLGRTTGGAGAAEEISVGSGLSLSAGSLSATSSSRSGDTATTSAVDITLTSSSDLIQRVDMTAASKKVTLPDATTMSEGEFFVIVNTGAYAFDIRANGGGLVSNLPGGEARIIWVSGVASAAGTWTALKTSAGAELAPGIVETLLSESIQEVGAAALTSTKAIVCYRRSSDNYGLAAVVDVSGTDLTWGTPAAYESAQTYYSAVAALSSTKAIVCYSDVGNSNYGTACILDISGSTVTPATAAVFESAATNSISVAPLSATKAIVCYKDDSNYGTACILDVSGSTITPATPAVFYSASSSAPWVTALSSTKAIVVFTSTNALSCELSISGSTITASTAKLLKTGSYEPGIVAVSASRAIAVTGNLAAIHVLNQDGTVLASKDIGISGAFFGYYGAVVKLTDGLVLAVAYDTNSYISGVAVEYTP